MASQRVFSGISRTLFDSIQAASRKDHGTTYVPPGSDTGQAVTQTAVGQVTLAKKPVIVTEGEVWSGIQSTIDACKA